MLVCLFREGVGVCEKGVCIELCLRWESVCHCVFKKDLGWDSID